MQMNPEFKSGGIPQYPIFLYGTHNLSWTPQDLIFPNNAQNYAKFVKKGKDYRKPTKNMTAETLAGRVDWADKFDKALEELDEKACVKCDIETVDDLDLFLKGELSLDISNWIDAELVNMDNLQKGPGFSGPGAGGDSSKVKGDH